jgi:ribonuclease Z
MSTLQIVFLGTSAAVPQKDRFLSSIALKRETGEILLFDCGEGTQYQMMKFGVNFMKISTIFFSHLHGDHIFGIFVLLNTMKLLDRKDPLTIYGPPGTQELLQLYMGAEENLGFPYKITIEEVMEGLVCTREDYRIFAKRVDHSVYTMAYALVEKDRLGRFKIKKAKELRVPQGKKWDKLQKGQAVLSKDNKVVTPEMVLGKDRRGFKIVIAFDGHYNVEDFVPFAHKADLLVLEATYGDDHQDQAKKRQHSTARWSAALAAQAQVARLYLTHISPRYQEDEELLVQAQEEFPGAVIAYDGLEVHLNRSDLEEEKKQ